MSVQTMLVQLSEATGVVNTSTDTRAQLLRYLNTAGREIWGVQDLPGSTFEQAFTLPAQATNTTNPAVFITLPWYCAGLRAVRWADVGQKVTLQDFRPKYHASPWRQPFLTWYIIQRIPLSQALSVESALTFTISQVQTTAFKVTVSGKTTTSTSVSETLTFLPGELTKTTVAQWADGGPLSITKTNILTTDVAITDGSGADVGLIPARQTQAQNILVRVADSYVPISFTPNSVIEVLYKTPYQELYFDEDVFLSPAFEDALIWRARANFEALQKDDMAAQRASGLAMKAQELLSTLCANQESEAEMTANFAPNRYYNNSPWSRRASIVRRGSAYV